jgi:integrase
MPAVLDAWKEDVLPRYEEKTRREYERQLGHIKTAFADFDVCDVKASSVKNFLRDNFAGKANTAKKYKALLSLVFSWAIGEDYIERNPAAGLDMKAYKEKKRDRYLTDSEVLAIKAAALTGKDGKATRSGPMMVCLMDLGYLTGQRIGDLLRLRWQDVNDAGIDFRPAKTVNSTGVRLRVARSPDLDALLERARAFGKVKSLHVIHTLYGQRYTYHGAESAWSRACERASVADANFHDLRAKALTDVKRAYGADAAQALGGHATAAMTAHYTKAREVILVQGPRLVSAASVAAATC